MVEDEELRAMLDMPISQLELSVRASNCLESMNISTLRELLRMREDDLQDPQLRPDLSGRVESQVGRHES